MKNIRIRVIRSCQATYWYFGVFDGKKLLMVTVGDWKTEFAATDNAKKFSQKTGIPYHDKICKKRGC